MFKSGNTVTHDTYGTGEIVSLDQDKCLALVAFEEEHELFIREIIDTNDYFEDRSRVEKSNFISVDIASLTKIDEPYVAKCHQCKKIVHSSIHIKCEECDWYKCDCGSCRCNYERK